MDFILYDGNIMAGREFNPGELWLKSCFSLSEEMWFANGEIPCFEAHMLNLATILSDLDKSMPADLPPQTELKRLSLRLINKNKAFMGGWLRMRFVFDSGRTHFFATVEPHPARSFPFDPVGKTGSVALTMKFSGNPLSRYVFFSENTWKTELFRLSGIRTEEPVILNEKGMVTEVPGANLFCIKKNNLLTPAAETGCIIDLFREKVLMSAFQIGMQTVESEKITMKQLLDMEEIFTVSEREGFKWIMGIDTRRFVKTKTILIWQQLNRTEFQDIS